MASAPTFMSIPISAIRDTSTDPVQQVPIIDGTGFVVRNGESYYLVTNWHIATGRDRVSGENLGLFDALPQRFMGWLHVDHGDQPGSLGWHVWAWNLYDENDRAKWYVHPEFGSQVDVVALPIDPPESINSGHDRPTRFFPYSLERVARPAALYPTSDVSIVGFPAGRGVNPGNEPHRVSHMRAWG